MISRAVSHVGRIMTSAQMENLMDYIIRKASHKDTVELANSAILMMAETENLHIDDSVALAGVERVLSDSSLGFYAVAETDTGLFAGSLFVTAVWMDLRCRYYWWIHCVHVRAPFRGNGVYEKLYTFVKEQAELQGNVIAVRLCVHDENGAARRAYEKNNMQRLPYLVYQERL